ncbi:hypothetical protein BJ546DRAFT_642252 [Cryomyces antarcticus]
MAQNSPPKRGGLSLYANLLNPSGNNSAPGTISGAPVVYKKPDGEEKKVEDGAAKKQTTAAAFRFQPIIRPQNQQKSKPKGRPLGPKVVSTPTATSSVSDDFIAKPAATAAPVVKSTLADWTADDDDVNGFYVGEKHQRGGRKKRKKNKAEAPVAQNWDDVYDITRPTVLKDWLESDERIESEREWKEYLYAVHARRNSSMSSEDGSGKRPKNFNFAPPSNMSFAPPQDPEPADKRTSPPTPPAAIPDDPTGEDAYGRRMRMSQMQPPPRPSDTSSAESSQPPPPPPAPAGTIARAPVRYNLSATPEDKEVSPQPAPESTEQQEGPQEAPRSLRPGQAGFAARLLKKHGWTEGTGLGASGSGIVNALRVQVEKRKKKSDAEGGGFVGPGGKGKIVGGKKNKADEEGSKYGTMSEVVVLYGMVDGLDLDAEMANSDGGLMQEIGEQCGNDYGRVERVYIHRDATGTVPVFVKFTSQLSGLRAVQALNGRIFNGNEIRAKYYDLEKFEEGIYE